MHSGSQTQEPEQVVEHMEQHRRLILGRSLLVGLSGIVPVPSLESMLGTSLRRGLLRRIAADRRVDISEAALDVLSGDSIEQQQLGVFAMAGALLSSLRPGRVARRMMAGLLLLRQLDQVLRTFHLASLFDHYCARHHLGAAMGEAQAYHLRAQIVEATRAAERGAVGAVFERALLAGTQALRAAPTVLMGLLHRHPAAAPAPAVLSAAEAAVHPTVLRLSGSALLTGYTRRLVSSFDRCWARSNAGGAGGAR